MKKYLAVLGVTGILLVSPAIANAADGGGQYNGHPIESCLPDITVCQVPTIATPIVDQEVLSGGYGGKPLTQENYDSFQKAKAPAKVQTPVEKSYGDDLCQQFLAVKTWLDSSVCN